MKIQVLVATATLALFATTTASAGKLTINSTNSSNGAIAVGDTFIAAGAVFPGVGAAGFVAGAGGRALAGSVQVNAGSLGCGCKRTVNITNSSNGAVAVGRASAGSTTINL